jgi:membrane protein required for colicin V production
VGWVDWAIVIVLAAATVGGLLQGFFRAVCSLGGLLLGLLLAAWNYGRVAAIFLPWVRINAIADAIGFLLIALVVMAAANLAGLVAAKTLRHMGLGCLDRLAGGVFGFLQGALLVTLGILVIVAFFPKAHWLAEARLPRVFFGVCHLSTHVSPAELAQRVRDGLRTIEQQSPQWMHPRHGPT